MSLLLCMSLCGTIFFLFAFCADFLALRSVGPRFVYRLYLLDLLLFLLPFQYYKYHYLDFFRLFIGLPDTAPSIAYSDNSGNLSIGLGNTQYFYPRIWALFFVISIVISVIYVIKQRQNYRKELCELDLFSTAFPDPLFDKACQNHRPFPKNHRDIKLYQSSCIHSPMTIGILCPRIFLPCAEYSEKERWFFYRHELFHIKNHDALIKLICFLSIAIHWYNPFIYFLFWKINQLSEYVCDENVLNGLSESDMQFYGDLLIRSSVFIPLNTRKPSAFGRSFSAHKNTLKRRLLAMKNVSPNKTLKKLFIPITVLALFLSAAVTVLGYSPAAAMEDYVSEPNAFSFENEDYFFVPDELVSDLIADIDFSDDSQVFIDENDNCFPVGDSETSLQASCVHIYVSGTINTHTLNASGGCTVKIYNAKRCTKCGYTIKVSLIGQNSYIKCPH